MVDVSRELNPPDEDRLDVPFERTELISNRDDVDVEIGLDTLERLPLKGDTLPEPKDEPSMPLRLERGESFRIPSSLEVLPVWVLAPVPPVEAETAWLTALVILEPRSDKEPKLPVFPEVAEELA